MPPEREELLEALLRLVALHEAADRVLAGEQRDERLGRRGCRQRARRTAAAHRLGAQPRRQRRHGARRRRRPPPSAAARYPRRRPAAARGSRSPPPPPRARATARSCAPSPTGAAPPRSRRRAGRASRACARLAHAGVPHAAIRARPGGRRRDDALPSRGAAAPTAHRSTESSERLRGRMPRARRAAPPHDRRAGVGERRSAGVGGGVGGGSRVARPEERAADRPHVLHQHKPGSALWSCIVQLPIRTSVKATSTRGVRPRLRGTSGRCQQLARRGRGGAAARCLIEVLPADALGLVLYQLPLAHDIAEMAPTCHLLCGEGFGGGRATVLQRGVTLGEGRR